MIFVTQESVSMKEKYFIAITTDIFDYFDKIKFHPSVLAARLFNMEYTDYLRYLRDRKNAILFGKNNEWIIAYFNSRKDCDEIVKELNRRWSFWVKMKEV